MPPNDCREALPTVKQSFEALAALEAGGVDNWEWYGESLRDYENEFGDIDIVSDEVIEKYQKIK